MIRNAVRGPPVHANSLEWICVDLGEPRLHFLIWTRPRVKQIQKVYDQEIHVPGSQFLNQKFITQNIICMFRQALRGNDMGAEDVSA